MPWVRIDDAFYDHAKWVTADPCEIGLWVIALAWSNRNLTDGRVPKVVLTRAGAHEETLDAMVAREILRDGGDQWEVVSYLEWQRSAEQIQELSKTRAAAGQAGGKSKANPKQNASKPEAEPQPQHQPKKEMKRRVAPTPEFEPTDSHRAYALEHGLPVEVQRLRWLAHCEAHGTTYASVNAGFTTWLHKAVDFGQGSGKPVATFAELTGRPPEQKVCGQCANTGHYFDKQGEFVECSHGRVA
jgi:hypothetical protein